MDRRQPPQSKTLQVVALMIAAASLLFGPCFGAAVAVVGNYVTNQTRSAVTETKLGTIDSKVDELRGKMDQVFQQMPQVTEHERRLKAAEDDIKRLDQRINSQDKTISTIGGMTAASVGEKK